jgi:hypothetical protein
MKSTSSYRLSTGGRLVDAISCRLRPGQLAVLVPGVEGDREQRPGLPFELHLLARLVPDAGGPPAVEDQHHLLEELALRHELAAGRYLDDVHRQQVPLGSPDVAEHI